jgi:hypothetical protein
MKRLLALLDGGTLGTQAEPSTDPGRIHEKTSPVQPLAGIGTLGTRGTLKTNHAASVDDIVQRVADITDTWHERMAICLEADDISHAEAETTAALEVGRAFVQLFVVGRVI